MYFHICFSQWFCFCATFHQGFATFDATNLLLSVYRSQLKDFALFALGSLAQCLAIILGEIGQKDLLQIGLQPTHQASDRIDNATSKSKHLHSHSSLLLTIGMSESDTTNEPSALSPARLLLLGVCVTLGSIINGINYTAINVTLEGISHSLKVKDGDLQWAVNSALLAFVSGCDTFR